MGPGAWSAGRRVGPLKVAVALAAASGAGFLVAQWMARPAAPAASAPATAPPATATPAPLPLPAVPYAPAPGVPAAPPARTSAPTGPPVAVPRAAGDITPSRIGAAEPAPAVAPPFEPLALQAVSEQDGQPVAIVNGQLVRVGDVLEGARIVRITPDSIEIDRDGRRVTIGF